MDLSGAQNLQLREVESDRIVEVGDLRGGERLHAGCVQSRQLCGVDDSEVGGIDGRNLRRAQRRDVRCGQRLNCCRRELRDLRRGQEIDRHGFGFSDSKTRCEKPRSCVNIAAYSAAG